MRHKNKYLILALCAILLLPALTSCGKDNDISYPEESLEKMTEFIAGTTLGISHDEVSAVQNEQVAEIFNLKLFDDYKSYPDTGTAFPSYSEFYSLWKLWDCGEDESLGRAFFEYYNGSLFSVSYICNTKYSVDRDAVAANQDSVVDALVKMAEENGYVRQEDISSWWGVYGSIDGERFLEEIFVDEISGEVFPAFGSTDSFEAPSEKPMIWFVSEDEKALLAIAPIDVLRSAEAQGREYPTDKNSKDYYYGYVYVVQYDIPTADEILNNHRKIDFEGKYYNLALSVEDFLSYNGMEK